MKKKIIPFLLKPNKPHKNDTAFKLEEALFDSEHAMLTFKRDLPKDFVIIREDDVSLYFGQPKWRLLWNQPVRSFYVH